MTHNPVLRHRTIHDKDKLERKEQKPPISCRARGHYKAATRSNYTPLETCKARAESDSQI